MKLLRTVLLLLLLLCAAAFGASYLLPTQIHVQQAIYLPEPREEVYPYLNDPTQWANWSVLSKKHDPSIIHLYAGPLRGKGSRLQWSGDRAGNGSIIFTESIDPDSISYQRQSTNSDKAIQGSFKLTDGGDSTKVVWQQQLILGPTPLERISGLLYKYKMEQETTQGLLGLKTLIHSKGKKRASL
ncbi:SRPBCC family protein [Pontibacter oryzae]|uniref:Polyketide cyclase n=1 Tax=Pontibacter oryzae TaxID=2304593 RepID=A0A399SGL2_9BACT|nr:SRPBCC family protein [Pontibacter oryzae]RIJ41693.1 hypothetical protein D1627_06615 [Pontibacter oryzae]